MYNIGAVIAKGPLESDLTVGFGHFSVPLASVVGRKQDVIGSHFKAIFLPCTVSLA